MLSSSGVFISLCFLGGQCSEPDSLPAAVRFWPSPGLAQSGAVQHTTEANHLCASSTQQSVHPKTVDHSYCSKICTVPADPST